MVKQYIDKASRLKKDASLMELIKSSGLVLFFKVLGAASGFVFAFVVSKYGAEVYGVFELAFTALMILAVVVKLGLDGATVRFTQEYLVAGENGKVKTLVINSLRAIFLFAAFISLLFFFLRENVADWFNEPALSDAYKWVAIGLVPFVLLQYFSETLRAFKNMVAFAIFQVGSVLIVATGIFFLMRNVNIPKSELTMLAFVLSTLIFLVLSIRAYSLSFRKRIGSVTAQAIHFGGIIKVGLPMLVSGSLFLVISWTDTLMIGYFNESADVGVYRIAFKVATLITFVQFAVNSIAAPNIANFYTQGNEEGLRTYVRQIGVINALCAIPIALIIVIFPQFLLNLFGAEYASGGGLLPILALGQLVNALCGPVMYILNMTGKEKLSQRIMLWISVLNIALNLILIPRFGILGAAIATSVSMILWNVIAAFLVYKYYKVVAIPFLK